MDCRDPSEEGAGALAACLLLIWVTAKDFDDAGDLLLFVFTAALGGAPFPFVCVAPFNKVTKDNLPLTPPHTTGAAGTLLVEPRLECALGLVVGTVAAAPILVTPSKDFRFFFLFCCSNSSNDSGACGELPAVPVPTPLALAGLVEFKKLNLVAVEDV